MKSLIDAPAKRVFGFFELLVSGFYTLLLSWNVAHHHTWADEAQAWVLARDLSLSELLGKYLHYEGVPALWHLFLWSLCRLHVSYAGMHWIAGCFALLGVVVFLRYAPFPAPIRALLPFSFYFFYEYAVVARSYVLIPLLLFSFCALFKNTRQNLWLLALLLGILANTCSHGAVMAGGFALILLEALCHQCKKENCPLPWRRLAGAASLFFVCALLAALTAYPAKDNSYFSTDLLVANAADQPVSTNTAQPSAAAARPATALARWSASMANFQKSAEPVEYGLSNSFCFSCCLLLFFVLYFVLNKNLLALVPVLFLYLFFVLIVAKPWHYGFVLITFLCLFWLHLERDVQSQSSRWTFCFHALLVVLLAEQCLWSAKATIIETAGSFSGDEQAARFLRDHEQGKRIAGFFFWSVGVQPWFEQNPFFNQHRHGFWFWSKNAPVNEIWQSVLNQHPDAVMLGVAVKPDNPHETLASIYQRNATFEPTLEELIRKRGYHEAHRFCGTAYAGQYTEGLCQILLEPNPAP